MYSIKKSISLFEQAQQYIPGGVNSPVRAFKSVGGHPIFMKSAKGAYLFDVDQNKYIDYINSWGPMILGHQREEVIDAIVQQSNTALSFGAPTELEVKIAALICQNVPNIDSIRLVNSGTEACMSAIRLARGYTGKNKFIKFEGCYHGHADAFLVKAGSGLATFDIQSVPGVTKATSEDTLVARFNDLNQVKELFEKYPNEIGAIIVEPVAGNMGCVPPNPGFLEGLRLLCNQFQAVLIFDEVMTGFRLSFGGAQQLLKVDADLVTFGKIIGGGMPVGAFGGKKEIMDHIAPVGQVYQAGTLSGNPLAVAAGLKTLEILFHNPAIYQHLDTISAQLRQNISSIFLEKGIDHTINNIGSMISLFFGPFNVQNFEDASKTNSSEFNRFFHHMLSHGIYLPPSAYETWFLSDALSDQDIDFTLETIKSF